MNSASAYIPANLVALPTYQNTTELIDRLIAIYGPEIDTVLKKYDAFASSDDIESMQLLLSEFGYSYLLDCLNHDSSDYRTALAYLPIVQQLKGTKPGLDLVLQLIGAMEKEQLPDGTFKASATTITEWWKKPRDPSINFEEWLATHKDDLDLEWWEKLPNIPANIAEWLDIHQTDPDTALVAVSLFVGNTQNALLLPNLRKLLYYYLYPKITVTGAYHFNSDSDIVDAVEIACAQVKTSLVDSFNWSQKLYNGGIPTSIVKTSEYSGLNVLFDGAFSYNGKDQYLQGIGTKTFQYDSGRNLAFNATDTYSGVNDYSGYDPGSVLYDSAIESIDTNVHVVVSDTSQISVNFDGFFQYNGAMFAGAGNPSIIDFAAEVLIHRHFLFDGKKTYGNVRSFDGNWGYNGSSTFAPDSIYCGVQVISDTFLPPP